MAAKQILACGLCGVLVLAGIWASINNKNHVYRWVRCGVLCRHAHKFAVADSTASTRDCTITNLSGRYPLQLSHSICAMPWQCFNKPCVPCAGGHRQTVPFRKALPPVQLPSPSLPCACMI